MKKILNRLTQHETLTEKESRNIIIDISEGKLTRKRQFCMQDDCGPGVFLAEHNDRVSCGKCGYTKFK